MISDHEPGADKASFLLFRPLFVLSIFSAPLYLGAVHLWSFSVSTTLLSAGFLFYWLKSAVVGPCFWVRTRIDFLVFLYVVLFGFSWFFSQIPSRSAEEAYKLAVIILFRGTEISEL